MSCDMVQRKGRIPLGNITVWTCCFTDEPERIDRHLRVLLWCREILEARRYLMITPRKIRLPHGVDQLPMKVGPDFNWEIFINREVPVIADNGGLLSVHEDGFPILPEMWDPEFLKYDYIGAPWPDRVVGNGGFNLESRRFQEMKMKLPRGRYDHLTASDYFACRTHRHTLNRMGARFAPYSVALRFSTETVGNDRPSFGFHGRKYSPEKYALGWKLIQEAVPQELPWDT